MPISNRTYLSGNKGEWAEIYIFLKLMSDGKVYAADSDMQKIENVFLNIIKIIREEVQGQVYAYNTGDKIQITLNGEKVGRPIDVQKFVEYKDILWNKLRDAFLGSELKFTDVDNFLQTIHIRKLKAPSNSKTSFGGTQDITMQVQDYNSGITSTIGFSCKSDFSAKATLFNASKDNTNFIYEVVGNIDDNVMDKFNSMYKITSRKNSASAPHTATGDRMRYLKEDARCNIKFVSMCKDSATRNLILSGGIEMPSIVAEMLRYYYYENEAQSLCSGIDNALQHVIFTNPANYLFENTESVYKRKISTLLYDMFTGMRLANDWDGLSSVNGGYIVVKPDGDVLAYHTCIADEFKDFLITHLGFDAPSASRHNYMKIFKENGRYYLKLNLQVRFK